MSVRALALGEAFGLLSALRAEGIAVERNASLPHPIPPAGLVIFRDGEPGEPDITLHPRTEYYQHRAEIEVFVLASEGDESTVYGICEKIREGVARNPGLSGRAAFCYPEAPELDRLDIEGAPRIIVGTFQLVIEYLVQDPLDAA